jgi:hypothetical protein
VSRSAADWASEVVTSPGPIVDASMAKGRRRRPTVGRDFEGPDFDGRDFDNDTELSAMNLDLPGVRQKKCLNAMQVLICDLLPDWLQHDPAMISKSWRRADHPGGARARCRDGEDFSCSPAATAKKRVVS